MTKDGSNYSNFYEHCQKKGPTLIIIKTTKNRIFGGFTPLNWIKGGGLIIDEANQTFIFSLDLMKKYDMRDNKKYAIRCFNYGPNFGNGDFFLKENLKQGESFANGSCNYLSELNLELTGGKGNSEEFQTEEFEVYMVKY